MIVSELSCPTIDVHSTRGGYGQSKIRRHKQSKISVFIDRTDCSFISLSILGDRKRCSQAEFLKSPQICFQTFSGPQDKICASVFAEIQSKYLDTLV